MMMGGITASCGHRLQDDEDTVSVLLAGEDCDAVTGYHKCVTYAEYCPKCAIKARVWPEWLEAEEDADRYLGRGVSA